MRGVVPPGAQGAASFKGVATPDRCCSFTRSLADTFHPIRSRSIDFLNCLFTLFGFVDLSAEMTAPYPFLNGVKNLDIFQATLLPRRRMRLYSVPECLSDRLHGLSQYYTQQH